MTTWFPYSALALALVVACGDDDGATTDAGADANGTIDAAVDAGHDAGVDAGPDLGPPVTGCELLETAEPEPLGGDVDPPAPDASGPLAGPGAPTRTFTEEELFVPCAHIDGGERDRDHHNTVLMLDGYLWLPFAHEGGIGGIRAFTFDDPCNPEVVGTGTDDDMRETHAAGLAYLDGRRWMATASMSGIQTWDITDPTDIHRVADLALPEVTYPNAYLRVVMSLFWQAPYIYVAAATLGIYIVDASDPTAPVLVGHYVPDPALESGGVHAIGTLLVVLPSQGLRNHLLDISDPARPRPIPGGTWLNTDGTTLGGGRPFPVTAYFGHVSGTRAYYARHVFGGGLFVYDLSDWSAPTLLGSWRSERDGANGGYVFLQNEMAFVGLSSHAAVVDVSDPTRPTLVAELEMQGDFDTLVPVGNVLVGSVDDDAIPGEASAVFPWQRELDTRAPRVSLVVPRDEATAVPLGARVGLSFDEHIELETLHTGSFYVRPIDDEGAPLGPPLEGTLSGQEGLYNFWPRAPLRPATRYEVVVPAGGVRDWAGNAVGATFRSTFTTASCGP